MQRTRRYAQKLAIFKRVEGCKTQQVPQYEIATNPAIIVLIANQPRHGPRFLQYSITTNPATGTESCETQLQRILQRHDGNKPSNIPSQQNPRAVWGGMYFGTGLPESSDFTPWRGAPTGCIPLRGKRSWDGGAGCSSHGSVSVQEATGNGPRSTNPHPRGGKPGSVPGGGEEKPTLRPAGCCRRRRCSRFGGIKGNINPRAAA